MTQFRKELSMFFSNFTFVWLLFFVLAVSGGFLWIFPDSSYLSYGVASTELFLELMNWLAILWIPIIAGSLIQYERNSGMLDHLGMIPTAWSSIIWAKFFAGALIVVLLSTLTSVHLIVLADIGIHGLQDLHQFAVSFLAMLLIFCCYLSMSLWVSMYIIQPIVGVVISVLLCFIFYQGFELVAQIPSFWGVRNSSIASFGLAYHGGLVSRGVISLSSFVYTLTLIIAFNYATIFLLKGGLQRAR